MENMFLLRKAFHENILRKNLTSKFLISPAKFLEIIMLNLSGKRSFKMAFQDIREHPFIIFVYKGLTRNLEVQIPSSGFCPTSADWGKIGIQNLG